MTPVKGKRETLKMKASIRYICGRCHNSHAENSLSHPVEMVPAFAIPPADLPLSWEGQMTCSTCHDIHASSEASHAQHRIPSLRRNAIGAELCAACHTDAANAAANNKKNHEPAMNFAHVKYTPDPKGGNIDRLSQMCLSCHDGGSLGGSADVQVRSGSWKHGTSFSGYDPQGSHPIGVKYRAAMRRGGLRPVSALNQAVKLIDGKVGCASCHNPFSKERYYLVVSSGRLCLECHDK